MARAKLDISIPDTKLPSIGRLTGTAFPFKISLVAVLFKIP
jgi:hypothetical protein